MQNFRWAFIGSGNIAKRAARNIIKGDHIITAVYSNSIKSADKFASKHNAAVFDSIDGLLKIGKFDGIYISAPQDMRYNYLLAAIQAGKPVLCETPACNKFAELDYLLNIAHEKKAYFRLIKKDYLTEFTQAAKEIKLKEN